MSVVSETKEYRSPRGKLLTFFEKSRDRWKERSRLAKRKIKRLSKGIAALEKSRDKWKSEALQLRKEARERKRATEEQKTRSP